NGNGADRADRSARPYVVPRQSAVRRLEDPAASRTEIVQVRVRIGARYAGGASAGKSRSDIAPRQSDRIARTCRRNREYQERHKSERRASHFDCAPAGATLGVTPMGASLGGSTARASRASIG